MTVEKSEPSDDGRYAAAGKRKGSDLPRRLQRGGAENRQHPAGHRSAWRDPDHRDVRGRGTGCNQPPGFERADIAQGTVEENDVRQVTGGLDDGLEGGARRRHPRAGSLQLRFAPLARLGIAVGKEDVHWFGARRQREHLVHARWRIRRIRGFGPHAVAVSKNAAAKISGGGGDGIRRG